MWFIAKEIAPFDKTLTVRRRIGAGSYAKTSRIGHAVGNNGEAVGSAGVGGKHGRIAARVAQFGEDDAGQTKGNTAMNVPHPPAQAFPRDSLEPKLAVQIFLGGKNLGKRDFSCF